MFSELQAVGYNGPTDDASVQNAYARTTGSAVTGGTSNSSSSSTAPPGVGTTTQTNLDAFNTAISQANQQAYQAYLNSKLQLDSDTLAFQKAQQAFSESISRAEQTGTFEGQPTLAAQLQQAQQLGYYQGSPTLDSQKQAADIAATQAGVTGLYYTPTLGPAPTAGSVPGATGSSALSQYAPGTVVRTQSNQFGVVGANGTLTVGDASNPAIYAAIQRGSGIITVPDSAFVASPAAVPGASNVAGASQTGTGQQTLAAQGQYFNQALALQTQNQKTVQDYLTLLSSLRGPQDYGQYLRTLASTPNGLQSLVGAAQGANPITGFGTTGVPGQAATLGGLLQSGATGVSGGAPGTTPQTGTPDGGTSYADYQAAAQGLPPPSQIAPQNWNAMTDSQKKLLLGMYESNGWNVTDAQQQYQASLPKFGSASAQSGSFKLV
jgi:hypothetical protein